MDTRRGVLKKILVGGGMLSAMPDALLAKTVVRKKQFEKPVCTLFRSVNGTPQENIVKVVEIMGGMKNIIGSDDLVVIKPNVQWWNQGVPNLAALKVFVEMIMERPGGFRGEVVIAENCHRGNTPWASENSGWARRFERNSDISQVSNMKELTDHLKKNYGDRFTICHWTNVASGARRVYGPNEGNGYVYCDGTGGVPLMACDNGIVGDRRRATIMTYPIFTTDKGTIVDFKNGIWEKGLYTEQPLRFINFAALNHHSAYCGITSAVKNYLGVSDLSGGPDPINGGRLTGEYFNFHSFPFDKWAPGPKPGMLGKEIGIFLDTVRKADLNITTAEWVGLASRVAPPVARTRAVMACTDPVALDYHAAKYVLYPNSNMSIHNPDKEKSPVRQYLKECAEMCGCLLDESHVKVESYDHQKKRLQTDEDLIVKGEMQWGSDPKILLKYFVLRYMV